MSNDIWLQINGNFPVSITSRGAVHPIDLFCLNDQNLRPDLFYTEASIVILFAKHTIKALN